MLPQNSFGELDLIMKLSKWTLAAVTWGTTSVLAVDILVQSSGGNVTGKFGHPYGYGFLHEVSLRFLLFRFPRSADNIKQDINNSGDGGIYAELIQNRAFQYSPAFPVSTDHYSPINGASLGIEFLDTPLSESLPASMRVSADSSSSSGKIGFTNDGYWGMAVSQQKYTGSFWVHGAYNGSFTASLQSSLTADVFGSVDIASKAVESEWTEHVFELVPTVDAPNSNNTFSLTFDAAAGALDFNLISLFPPTYKDRKNGLRVDIAEALADLNPVSHGSLCLVHSDSCLTSKEIPPLPRWQHVGGPHERNLLGLEGLPGSSERSPWISRSVGLSADTRPWSDGISRVG